MASGSSGAQGPPGCVFLPWGYMLRVPSWSNMAGEAPAITSEFHRKSHRVADSASCKEPPQHLCVLLVGQSVVLVLPENAVGAPKGGCIVALHNPRGVQHGTSAPK